VSAAGRARIAAAATHVPEVGESPVPAATRASIANHLQWGSQLVRKDAGPASSRSPEARLARINASVGCGPEPERLCRSRKKNLGNYQPLYLFA
jgi:hypothetical protein